MNGFEIDEVKQILSELGIDYTIEKGENGTETIVAYGKEGNIVASFNDKEANFWDFDFQDKFMWTKENPKELENKEKSKKINEKKDKNIKKIINKKNVEEKNNEENKDEKENDKDVKNLSEKDAVSEEVIQEALGDDYEVVAKIEDDEISDTLNETEKFIGYPYSIFNKNTKEFNIVGNKGKGNLELATLNSTRATVPATKIAPDGSKIEDRHLTGIMNLPNSDEFLSIELDEHGQMQMTKIVRGKNNKENVAYPVENTKQIVPSNKEIEEMKENSKSIPSLKEIIDEKLENNVYEMVSKEELERISKERGLPIQPSSVKEANAVKEEVEEIAEKVTEKNAKNNKKNNNYSDDDDEFNPRNPRDNRWA